MISRQYRFLGLGSLKHLFRRGRTITLENGCLRLRWAPNRHRSNARLAVIVSKKVSKKAVIRNRIRRRCFEFWRPHLPQLPAVDLALTIVDARLADQPWNQLTRANQQLLNKLRAVFPKNQQ